MSLYIGIDPGVSGGIVALNDDGIIRMCVKMPPTMRDVWDTIYMLSGESSFAIIEQLGHMPRQGYVDETGKKQSRAMQSPKTMLVMGRSYGHLEMALTAACIRFSEVLPRKWQRDIGITVKDKESKTDKKNRHKELAQQLFPGIKVTHAIADALLIAEVCRRGNR